MKNRRTFITALGLSSLSAAFASRAEAQSAAPAATTPAATPQSGSTDSPGPKGTAAPKPVSALALATAATMRRFDPKLTDAQIEIIARGIDANASFGAQLNPKKKRLRNGDEPVTSFVVPFS